jgi:hypothetical protein
MRSNQGQTIKRNACRDKAIEDGIHLHALPLKIV